MKLTGDHMSLQIRKFLSLSTVKIKVRLPCPVFLSPIYLFHLVTFVAAFRYPQPPPRHGLQIQPGDPTMKPECPAFLPTLDCCNEACYLYVLDAFYTLTCIFRVFFFPSACVSPRPTLKVVKSSSCLLSAVYLFMSGGHSYRESWTECSGEVPKGGDRKEGSRAQGAGVYV